MIIPLRYEDLTVEQFQKLEALKSRDDLDKLDSAIMRLSILSNKSVDEVEAMSPNEVFNTLSLALYLVDPIHDMPVVEEITLGKKKFKAIIELSDLNISQHKDFNEFIKMHNGNYIECLPELISICHKEYVNDDVIKHATHIEPIKNEWRYMEQNHKENIELFRQAKLKDVLGAVFFYSGLLQSYKKIIETCLEESQKDIVNHVEMMMSDQEFLTFLKDGDMSSGLVK